MSAPKTTAKNSPKTAAQHTMARRHLQEAGGAAGGALTGAAVGAIAGPPGAVAGAVIGGVVGALVAKVADEEDERTSFHDHELDEIIGVTGGEIGASNLKHPPAVRGAYSAASTGAATSGGAPAEGPIPVVED